MKSIIASLVLSSCLLVVTTVMAEPSPQADCSIRRNGNYTGEIIRWNQFFTTVDQYSRRNGCSVGKISYTAESGRMYIDGRKVGSNLSNSEMNRLRRQYGYSEYTCPTFTCDEIGNTPGYPQPYPPTYPNPYPDPGYPGGGGGYSCIEKVVRNGYSQSSAYANCQDISSNAELNCVDLVLDRGFGPSNLQPTCRSVSFSQVQCIRSNMNKGLSPISAKNRCRY